MAPRQPKATETTKAPRKAKVLKKNKATTKSSVQEQNYYALESTKARLEKLSHTLQWMENSLLLISDNVGVMIPPENIEEETIIDVEDDSLAGADASDIFRFEHTVSNISLRLEKMMKLLLLTAKKEGVKIPLEYIEAGAEEESITDAEDIDAAD